LFNFSFVFGGIYLPEYPKLDKKKSSLLLHTSRSPSTFGSASFFISTIFFDRKILEKNETFSSFSNAFSWFKSTAEVLKNKKINL
jgi:hypothetical protein